MNPPLVQTTTTDFSFPIFLSGQVVDGARGGPSSQDQDSLTCHTRPVARPITTKFWGTQFAQVDMQQAIELADRVVQARFPEYFITANLNYLMLADQHPRLIEVNEGCCCILADGFPILLRSKLGKDPLPCRVAGSDMIIELARLAAARGYRIYLLGGLPSVAQAAAKRLRELFPQLQVAGTESPPFRALDAVEQQEMIQRIRDARTDILLVAFGQPKGELWIFDHLQDLCVPLCVQLGASFDFLAGTAQRAPKIWQSIGCEWLYRAFSDPKRLLPRYARNIQFLAKLLVKETAVNLATRINRIFRLACGWPRPGYK